MDKKKSTVLFVILGIVNIVFLIITLCTIKVFTAAAVCEICIQLLVLTYTFYLYKKAHGNILKHTLLLFSAFITLEVVLYLTSSASDTTLLSALVQTMRLFGASAMCYCAGRLNRIKENKKIFTAVDCVLIITSLITLVESLGSLSVLVLVRLFNVPVIFTTLFFVYLIRYKGHTEASNYINNSDEINPTGIKLF